MLILTLRLCLLFLQFQLVFRGVTLQLLLWLFTDNLKASQSGSSFLSAKVVQERRWDGSILIESDMFGVERLLFGVFLKSHGYWVDKKWRIHDALFLFYELLRTICFFYIMNKQAPGSVRTVAMRQEVFAELGFVVVNFVCSLHYLVLVMCKWTLVTELAETCHFKILAHLGSEFVYMRGRRHEKIGYFTGNLLCNLRFVAVDRYASVRRLMIALFRIWPIVAF
jgi:hypothetical protein